MLPYNLLNLCLVVWFIVILTIFTIWSYLCFVFRYSAVLIITALYVASGCNRSLPSSFLHTQYVYRCLGDIIIIIIIIIIQPPVTDLLSPLPLLLKSTPIPITQGSIFTLQPFLYYVWYSKYSCLLYWIYWMFSCFVFVFWSFLVLPVIGHMAAVSARKLTSTEIN